MVAWVGFYSYYIYEENKSDKERKIERTKLSIMHTKGFNTFFKRWVQFRMGAIPPSLPVRFRQQTKLFFNCGILQVCFEDFSSPKQV